MQKHKKMFITGAAVIALTPLWWFIVPNFISPIFCNPADYQPPKTQIILYPCSNVYVPMSIGFSVANLMVGALLILLATKEKSQNNIKK